jgi:HAMP domain-containing protein
VGLRTKFNLMLMLIALAGVVAFALASTPVLDDLARDEVLQTSRVMMASAAGARKYTSEEITPLLKPGMAEKFHPQAVSAYAAKKTFAVLRTRFEDYSYREAALNPTNPEDRASDWEADIINDFRDHPTKTEVVMQRQTANGPALTLARPLVNVASCLECHSTPQAAPASMIAVYGPYHGFGWKPGDIIGAQLVSVPMMVAEKRVDEVRVLFLIPYTGVFLLLFVALNVLLDVVVIGPIDRMAKTAEAVSMGDLSIPEYVRAGNDQIAHLSGSINRLRRSLHEALRMLSEP